MIAYHLNLIWCYLMSLWKCIYGGIFWAFNDPYSSSESKQFSFILKRRNGHTNDASKITLNILSWRNTSFIYDSYYLYIYWNRKYFKYCVKELNAAFSYFLLNRVRLLTILFIDFGYNIHTVLNDVHYATMTTIYLCWIFYIHKPLFLKWQRTPW